ncbi:DUF4313 domain-containing protein (plasmid) [Lachnospiraceae bacterium WCA-9-b2]|uniref:DUF4313 domain-containing protein n=1 Tax=Sporofaciens musculi TaxID=2681861 RepID=A0A7X3MMA1_9FIRM|nr:DUF4313 domain-containing protein [Sporofaciens musculi]
MAIALFEEGEPYGNLTCCLDDAPGRNCAYIDVNNMGVDIVDVLEKEGFGKRTGKSISPAMWCIRNFHLRRKC